MEFVPQEIMFSNTHMRNKNEVQPRGCKTEQMPSWK